MPSFLTQCPHCLTSFRVTNRQLDAAEGRVRCGACLGIFSAEANRIIVKPTPDEIAAADARELAEFEDDEELDTREEIDAEDEALDDSDSDEFDGFDEEEVDDEEDADEFDADEDDEPATATSPDDETDTADLLESHDFDIPLGDLNLDLDEDEDEDEDYEDEAEAAVDADAEAEEDEPAEEAHADFESDESDEFDEFDEDDELEDAEADGLAPDEATGAKETRLIDIVYEEYLDEDAVGSENEPEPSEEFKPEFIFEDEDDEIDADAAAEDEHDLDDEDDVTIEDADEDDDPVLVTPPRYTNPRSGADKTALRNYLADIEDDEALDPLDEDALADLDEPVLLEAAPHRSRLAVFALLLANFALVALLVWQYADEHIEQLSRSARFASLMPYACRVLDCPEPQRAQPDLFVSEQLLVRSHPRYAQALEVNLVFRNGAPEAQPFPALELGFHDTSNRMVANRLFQPAEYLPAELQTSEMPAQSSIQVTLELVDPGSDAVNYTLAFHAP